jgi:hypothetical protein
MGEGDGTASAMYEVNAATIDVLAATSMRRFYFFLRA